MTKEVSIYDLEHGAAAAWLQVVVGLEYLPALALGPVADALS